MKTTRVKGSQYRSSEQTVKVPDNDTDINIVLPNGEHYCFQYRVENQTVDLCIGNSKTLEPLQKACYLEDGDMRPGKKSKGLPAHARMAAQIVII
jgi:hypothetical protein